MWRVLPAMSASSPGSAPRRRDSPRAASPAPRAAPATSTASRMCLSQASRSASPMTNGSCRIRSRGWPALLAVGVGAAPVLDQEAAQPLLGARQVLLGVERPEQRVVRHPLVEAVHETAGRSPRRRRRRRRTEFLESRTRVKPMRRQHGDRRCRRASSAVLTRSRSSRATCGLLGGQRLGAIRKKTSELSDICSTPNTCGSSTMHRLAELGVGPDLLGHVLQQAAHAW